MAKGKLEFNTFVKGIITEAGPLTYPDGASLDEANFVLNRDGSRQRRFGIDYEEGFQLHPLSSIDNGGVIATHRWENPDNAGSLDILVVQDGSSLTFFNANSDAISADQLNAGNPVSTGFEEDTVISTASINGKMFITGGSKKVIELSFDRTTELVAKREINLHMRDLWGVDDGLSIDERPSVLEGDHEYNLRNQGWVTPFDCAKQADLDREDIIKEDPLSNTKQKQGYYPSNADILHVYKAESADSPAGIGVFSSFLMDRNAEGTTEAPKGSIVLEDIWDRGAERASKAVIPSNQLPADSAEGIVSAVAAYAGRLFYSFSQASLTDGDANSPNLNTLVAYSQVGTENAGKCHSFNDPSAETFNDPLDTDGGFVVIPEIGEIYDMKPLGDSLFVIASNGVWEIHGGEGSFTATKQNLSKVTTVGALSRKGLLAAEDAIAYWAKGGIYVISIDATSLRGVAQNITQSTIQSLYDAIPATAKRQVSAVYDNVARQMRWLYREGNIVNDNLYNRELVFDLNLSAFYRNEFGELPDGNYAYPAGYIDVADVLITQFYPEPITNEGIPVTVGGEPVTLLERSVSESVKLSTKFLGVVNTGEGWEYTACQYQELDFVDWPQIAGGIDSPARLLTGYWTGGKSTNDKRMPYLFTHFRRTEQGFEEGGEGGFNAVGESSCVTQAQWEWTDSSNAGRWGVSFEAYRLPRLYTPNDINDPMDYGFTVVTTKNKVRGHGNALSLNFTTKPRKNCHIYGWAIEILEEDS